MTPEEALRQVPFLRTVPPEVIGTIAAAGQKRSLQRGEVLFAENTPCLGLIVVLSGAVRIYKIDHRGREITLGTQAPGTSVSELPLFDGGSYPASAEATQETLLFIVGDTRFQELMQQHPEIARQALRALAARMRNQVQIIEVQTLHSVQARLASYLLHASQGQTTFLLEETNEAIAGHIGSVRDVVSRTLGVLRHAGMIKTTGRRVSILSDDALRLMAGSENRQPEHSERGV